MWILGASTTDAMLGAGALVAASAITSGATVFVSRTGKRSRATRRNLTVAHRQADEWEQIIDRKDEDYDRVRAERDGALATNRVLREQIIAAGLVPAAD